MSEHTQQSTSSGRSISGVVTGLTAAVAIAAAAGLVATHYYAPSDKQGAAKTSQPIPAPRPTVN
jgi:hypothetical protein